MKTYPHMNELIVGILRLDDDSPHDLYAAQLIEELQAQLAAKEAENARLREALGEIVAIYPDCTNTKDMRDIAAEALQKIKDGEK